MRIIYMGTPEIAVKPLKALYEAGHDIALCVTQPDKPSSRRGNKVVFSPVKAAAAELGIDVYQPLKASSPESEEYLSSVNADIIVVCAYGQLLKKNILYMTSFGCLNIHASLLPQWRGAAPINRAIMNGDRKSGVTIMYMDEGLDTGDMMISGEIGILPEMTAGSLYDEMGNMGAELIVKALELLENKSAPRIKQNGAESTYAAKISKEELYVSFDDTAENVFNKIRGLDPNPAAYTVYEGNPVKLYGAYISDFISDEPAGTIIPAKNTMYVKCRDKCVGINEVKPSGKALMNSSAFINGIKNKSNIKFGR